MAIVSQGGRLAPRWVMELMNGTLSDDESDSRRSIRTRLMSLDPDIPAQTHSHSLVLLPKQTSASGTNPRIISMVCRTCDFHFVVTLRWDASHTHTLCNQGRDVADKVKPFPPPEVWFPMHHLVHMASYTAGQCSEYSSFDPLRNPLIGRETFECSAPECTLEVTLDISEPRLSFHWLKLLTDQARIRALLEEHRASQPNRYTESHVEWLDSGPSLLNTYLRNRLDGNDRNISKRNKRFQVVFGSAMWPLFERLGYTPQTLSTQGVPEDYFVPEALEPIEQGKPTAIGSRRAHVEDMQAEVESYLIRSKGRPAESGTDNYVSGPVECALGCYAWSRTRPDSGSLETAELRILGIPGNLDPSLIMYAYHRQIATWPANRHLIIESLVHVSTRHGGVEFQSEAAKYMSMMDERPDQQQPLSDDMVAEAYLGLGLDPSNPQSYGDHDVAQAFKAKINEDGQGHDQIQQAWGHVGVLGNARSSRRLQELAGQQLQMSIGTACHLLSCHQDDSPYFIKKQAKEVLQNQPDSVSLETEVCEALYVIGLDRNKPELTKLADEISQQAMASKRSHGTITGRRTSDQVGLRNIGNTCYLNSILQVLRRYVFIRELLDDFDNRQLPLTDKAIASRLIGGSRMKITRAEAVVGHALVDELADLFRNMEKTSEPAVRPTQRLANAVLISTTQITNGLESDGGDSQPQGPRVEQSADQQEPPPLPTRPSPLPPTSCYDVTHVEHAEVAAEGDAKMTDEASTSAFDAASQGSTETLVENVDVMDVELPAAKDKATQEVIDLTVPSDDGKSNDEKILAALLKQKRSSGTDQQDVEETMGNILNRLQAAIQPDKIPRQDGIQLEAIMETLYIELAQYTEKSDGPLRKEALDRAITAYPAARGSDTVYQCLSRNLDQQEIQGTGWFSHTSIKQAPPILHVLVQRTTNEGRKNSSVVILEPVLYLDRFMDDKDNPELLKIRKDSWFLQRRLERISEQPKKSDGIDKDVEGRFFAAALNSSDEDQEAAEKPEEAETAAAPPVSLLDGQPTLKLTFPAQPFVFKRQTDTGTGTGTDTQADTVASVDTVVRDAPDDVVIDSNSPMKAVPGPRGLPSSEEIDTCSEKKAQVYAGEIEKAFSKHKKYGYRLFAVICHSGQLSAGHYWVWIRDFEKGIWRKFNDETVTEHSDEKEVFEILNKSGDPYFLCYVRDGLEKAAVREPVRVAPEDMMDIDLTGPAATNSDTKSHRPAVEIHASEEEVAFPLDGHPNTPTADRTDSPPTYERRGPV